MWPLPDELSFSPPGRVLWITDLGDIPVVLPVVIGYATRAKAHIRLFHTLGMAGEPPAGLVVAEKELSIDPASRAAAVLEQTVAELRSAGVECDWQLDRQPMEVSLRELSEAWDPDRIIRARRRGTFRGGLDPDTEIILRYASVPVLVINPDEGPVIFAQPPRILFPTSLDRQERATAISVLRFARSYGAEITMLHVIDDGPDWNSRVKRVHHCADQQFREILEEWRGLRTETLIELGSVPETVVRIAQQGYDLILLSVFSGVSFRSDLRPGAAYKILCTSSRPVLVCKRNVAHPFLARDESELTLVGSRHLPPA